MTSAARGEDTPRDGLPQVALVGRSNVGKSTLINALTKERLARTSAKPGKTRLANIYRIVMSMGQRFYLVDLPGYGYARGGEASQREFQALATGYFGLRREGHGPAAALMVIDARHPALETDIEARGWLAAEGVPTIVATNKVDKLSRAERARMARQHAEALDAPIVELSAARGEGLDELWTQIARLLRNPKP
ncbi:MAG: ribosome biogenesis GTP-binding protein YihA/YsxC [Acidobacteriota bacterium]|nr:ribosome biogenesis GTP-binding protein YihA/YsxC [Acidobacteriota bacterium]